MPDPPFRCTPRTAVGSRIGSVRSAAPVRNHTFRDGVVHPPTVSIRCPARCILGRLPVTRDEISETGEVFKDVFGWVDSPPTSSFLSYPFGRGWGVNCDAASQGAVTGISVPCLSTLGWDPT